MCVSGVYRAEVVPELLFQQAHVYNDELQRTWYIEGLNPSQYKYTGMD